MLELCFLCLERRLGRPLVLADFDEKVPVNQGIYLGFRLSTKATS